MMTRKEIDRIKAEYTPGSHVKLIEMKGEPQMLYGLRIIEMLRKESLRPTKL